MMRAMRSSRCASSRLSASEEDDDEADDDDEKDENADEDDVGSDAVTDAKGGAYAYACAARRRMEASE